MSWCVPPWWLSCLGLSIKLESNCLLEGGAALPPCSFGLKQPSPRVYRLCDRASGDHKRAHANGHVLELLLPVPLSLLWAAATSHFCRRPFSTAGGSGSVSCGSLLLSPGSWYTQDFVCALQEWSLCLPQSCRSPTVKSCWPSRSGTPGISSPFVRSPGWEAWCEAQNLHVRGRTSLMLWFTRFVSHSPGGYGIWFYHGCAPAPVLLQLLLCLWTRGILFLVGSSSSVNSCSTAISVLLQVMRTRPSALPSRTNLSQ